MKPWVSANAKSNAAILISTVALVVVGGGAFAAGTVVGKNSVGSAQIKDHSIQLIDIASAAVEDLEPSDQPPVNADVPEGFTDRQNGLAYQIVSPEKMVLFSYTGCGTVPVWLNFYDANGVLVGTHAQYAEPIAKDTYQDVKVTFDQDYATFSLASILCVPAGSN